jgi:hypothetical protein
MLGGGAAEPTNFVPSVLSHYKSNKHIKGASKELIIWWFHQRANGQVTCMGITTTKWTKRD